MRIEAVTTDDLRFDFEVTTHRGSFRFPYVRCEPAPNLKDRVVAVFVDPELGHEAFTFRLESGAEGSVHVDSVLDVNGDEQYLAEIARYRSSLHVDPTTDRQ